MRFGKSSNPVLSKNRFENMQVYTQSSSELMTLNGTLNKALILSGLLLVTGVFSWNLTKTASFNPMTLIIGGAIGGLVIAIFTVMKPERSSVTAPLYALFEGLFVGALSAMYDSFLDGIVMQAIGLTLSILLIMLLLYRSGMLKATPKFKKGVFIATGGVAFFYIINLIAGFFGGGISFFNLGWMGIGISLVIIVIAAMNLILDFDMIETGIKTGQPKYMEWYASFGIMVTLIWLYIEILRLLALLAGRD